MQFRQLTVFSAIALALTLLPAVGTLPAVASTRKHSTTAAHKTGAKTSVKSKHGAVKSKMTSQRTIDDERAAQIQTALIKAGYLPAPPSGHWDTASIAAMTKVQADNGWQTKLVPDSRALIKLGLGPGAASGDQPSPAASIAPAQAETLARN